MQISKFSLWQLDKVLSLCLVECNTRDDDVIYLYIYIEMVSDNMDGLASKVGTKVIKFESLHRLVRIL